MKGNESNSSRRLKMKDYDEKALRTESPITPELLKRLVDSVRLLHALMGKVTEAGELMDQLKRHIFYGKDLDAINIVEELGDDEWYGALCRSALFDKLFRGVTQDEVQRINIEKLTKRYPEKYTHESALNRDLAEERKVLEGNKIGGDEFLMREGWQENIGLGWYPETSQRQKWPPFIFHRTAGMDFWSKEDALALQLEINEGETSQEGEKLDRFVQGAGVESPEGVIQVKPKPTSFSSNDLRILLSCLNRCNPSLESHPQNEQVRSIQDNLEFLIEQTEKVEDTSTDSFKNRYTGKEPPRVMTD